LAQLSVFQGGFDKEMAARVCNASLPVLLKLVNKSLVMRREQRFVLHELVRQYSQPHLQDLDPTLERLASLMLELTEQWKQHKKDQRQSEFSKRLENDHDNIRTVLGWSLEHQPKIGAAMAGNLEHFWYTRGHHTEGFAWAEKFLHHYTVQDEVQMQLLWTRTTLAKELSDYDESRQMLGKYKVLAKKLKNADGLASAEKFLGLLEREQGNLALSKKHLENAKAMFEKSANRDQIAICLNDIGIVVAMQGDLEVAKAHFTESLSLKRLIGEKMGIAYAIANLGVIAGQQGDLALERVLHIESLQMKRELGDKQGIANGLQTLGVNALKKHLITEALEYFGEALQLFVQLGRRYSQTFLLFDFAKIAWGLGEAQTALEFVEGAIQGRYAIRSQPEKSWLISQRDWQKHSGLSPAELAQLEFDVQKQSLEQLIQHALAWKDSERTHVKAKLAQQKPPDSIRQLTNEPTIEA
jgi:tetratricopeptide (TPR) repeat protein